MLKRIGKNMTAILVALGVICAMCFAGYEIYDNFIKEESVYAVARQGSTGNEVKSIQKKLKELGYYKGEIDGIYGSKTKSAVISFSKKLRLDRRRHMRKNHPALFGARKLIVRRRIGLVFGCGY